MGLGIAPFKIKHLLESVSPSEVQLFSSRIGGATPNVRANAQTYVCMYIYIYIYICAHIYIYVYIDRDR